MAVREVVMAVDRVPHRFEMCGSQLSGLGCVLGHEEVEQPNRWPRGYIVGDCGIPITRIISGGILPAPLGDDQNAEAELGHDLGRLGADARRVKTLLRMRNRPRPDLDFGDFVVLAVERKAMLRQSFTDDDRGLDETLARPS